MLQVGRSIAYTCPESLTPYTGQYPDILEFEKPWEGCIQVGQGMGDISFDGNPIQSEGFSKCIAMILKNQNNLESALFHIDDIDLNHFQTKLVDEMIKNHLCNSDIDSIEKDVLLNDLTHICKYEHPANYGGMSREEFQERMEELNRNGVIQARFVSGTIGRYWVKNRIVESLLGYLGVNTKEDIIVDTGNYHWAFVYKPKEDKILVQSKSQNKVLTFGF